MNLPEKFTNRLTKYKAFVLLVLLCICLLTRQIQGSLECRANDHTVVPLSPNAYPFYESVPAPTSNGSRLTNMTCVWNITAPPSHILIINIDIFILSNDSNACPHGETFEIFDGPKESSRSLFNGCSRVQSSVNLKEKVFTSGHYAVIKLKTLSASINSTVILFNKFHVATLNTCTGDGVVTNLTAAANSSNITSPYYEYGYPKNISCAWRITAPSNQIVKLQIEAKVMCHMNDRLEIYDSQGEPENVLENLCSTAKLTLYSLDHVVYIVFSSNTTYQPSFTRRFMIHYSAMLPGTTCSPSNTPDQNKNIIIRQPIAGTLTSPNFPNAFPTNLDCWWKFVAPPGQAIKMYFDTVNMNVEPTSNCAYKPYLRVWNGFKEASPVLRFISCSYFLRHLKPSFFVLSSGQKLSIKFLSETHRQVTDTGYGFTANYTFQSLDTSGTCGEARTGIINLRGQGASFSSPGYEFHSKMHPKNMTCLWNITADPGFIINIETIYNALTLGCESEFVKVYDGATLDSPVLGIMCYRKTPYYLYSTGNHVLVEMKTSSLEQRGKGFQMSYRAVKYKRSDYICSPKHRTITIEGKAAAKVMSPWYPVGYPNNVYCVWMFTSPFGTIARLNITKLHLQDSMDCKADYMTVTGGIYLTSPVHRVLCGKPITPISFVSSERKLMIRLNSDWFGRYPGFEADFDSFVDTSFGDCKVQGQDNRLSLNSSSGFFFSPRYPKGIPRNMTCTWVITADEGSYVRLEFQDFDLDFRCRKNSELVIRDGSSAASKILGTFCGSKKPPSIFSSGRHLWVRFISKDFYVSIDKGFKATYRTITALPSSISCRGQTYSKLDSSSGQIASHDYPVRYGNNVFCEWTIKVSDGKRIKLTFDSFNIQKTPGCSGDFVEVFDGSSQFSDSLGKFCGDEKPEPVSSSDRYMYIRFQSDKSGQYPGFKASYESELSVRSIILIVVFTLVGIGAILSLIGWCCKNQVAYHHNPQPAPLDGAASTAGSNIELTAKL